MFKKRIHLVNHLFPQIGKREYNKILNNGSLFLLLVGGGARVGVKL